MEITWASLLSRREKALAQHHLGSISEIRCSQSLKRAPKQSPMYLGTDSPHPANRAKIEFYAAKTDLNLADNSNAYA
jgi:hypothetical protein